MKTLRYLLSAITLATASAVWASPAKITASIDSTVVEMGSHAMITVNVVDPSHSGHVVDLPEDGTDAEAFDFVTVESDTTPTGFTYNLKIQAWYPGVLTLAPFKYVAGTDTAESDVLTLKILPVEMDSTQQLNPMEGAVNMPSRWYDFIPEWSLWVLLGLVGLALIAAVIYLWLLYRRTGSIILTKPKPVDPYAEAIEALKQLRSRRLAESGKEKEYYTALIDILRVYLFRRFAINAMEMSSTQILDSLRRNPETKGDQPRIKQILDLADIVKFAKMRPMPDDNIKSFNTVEQFVEATKPLPPASAEEEKNNKNKNK